MNDAPAHASDEPMPRHVAVIMDGNGRWAQQRGQPRNLGHRAGLKAMRKIVRAATQHNIAVLTVFAFSQENWQRPATEVGLLMRLFANALGREIKALHKNNIRIRFIGERTQFATPLRDQMHHAETLTADNSGLALLVATGYGGHWDIVQAANALVQAAQPITAETLQARLSTRDLPPPDLLIRTGGEYRISNFLLWQLAYTELYFSPLLWPDFDADALAQALAWYAGRVRRFGRVLEAPEC